MNTFKKRALLLGMLANLTTVSLTGCAEKLYCSNMTIKYEDGKANEGNILYNSIYGNIKVLLLEYNGVIKPYLIVIKNCYNINYDLVCIEYYDLKSRTLLITMKEDGTVTNGGYFTILEEHEFMDYFIEVEELKPKYDVTELIDYYDTNIEPKLTEYCY